ncbi:MAG: WYL domain-containing protein [Trichlorobacter sp.]
MEDQTVNLPWGAKKRLQFLEFKLYWEGRVNRGDLTAEFGISIPQASVDLTKYQEMAPHNISYDASGKYYVPTESFKPIFIELSADAYFSTILYAPVESLVTCGPNYIGLLPTPSRTIDLGILRTLIQGIKNKQIISVDYRSFNNPQPGNPRMISPHAFGSEGTRWHVRAYCHESNTFKDFVLGRIASASNIGVSDIDSNLDMKWFSYFDVEIGPNPKLSDHQKNVVAMDYGMTDFKFKLSCRRALLYYVLKKLSYNENLSGEEQQIIAINCDEISAVM